MKTCTKCLVEKPLEAFDKWRNQCRSCRNTQRNKRLALKPMTLNVVSEKTCGCCKVIKPNTEFNKEARRIDGLTSYCKECRQNVSRKYYKNNSKAIKKKWLNYYYSHKKEIFEKRKPKQSNRLKSDPLFMLKRRLRNRLYYALQKKSWKKNTQFSEYIGCSLEQLKEHIEKQFVTGMSWANQGEWHIDHIIPLDSAKTPEELYVLSHYSNLQPLWAKDNLSKGTKIKKAGKKPGP